MTTARRRVVTHPGEVVAVVGGAALLTSSWVVVALERRVPGWEARVFHDLNNLNGTWWAVVRVPMQIGSLPGSLAAVVVVYAVTSNARLAGAALLGTQAAYWGAKLVKELVSRARPGALLGGVRVREHVSGLWYLSGHTAVAFALAAVLAPSLPRAWRPVAFAVAALVGFARVYGGAHLPLDVVGGAGLGLLCGTFARWALGLGGEGLRVRRAA
jgi:membrane-associated phospholipid phosphatase